MRQNVVTVPGHPEIEAINFPIGVRSVTGKPKLKWASAKVVDCKRCDCIVEAVRKARQKLLVEFIGNLDRLLAKRPEYRSAVFNVCRFISQMEPAQSPGPFWSGTPRGVVTMKDVEMAILAGRPVPAPWGFAANGMSLVFESWNDSLLRNMVFLKEPKDVSTCEGDPDGSGQPTIDILRPFVDAVARNGICMTERMFWCALPKDQNPIPIYDYRGTRDTEIGRVFSSAGLNIIDEWIDDEGYADTGDELVAYGNEYFIEDIGMDTRKKFNQLARAFAIPEFGQKPLPPPEEETFETIAWRYHPARNAILSVEADPEMVNYVPKGIGTADFWITLIRHCPKFAELFNLTAFSPCHWEDLLKIAPQLDGKRDWTELDGGSWVYLLPRQPEFAEKCDWTKLDGGNWANLLAPERLFFNDENWAHFLLNQPRFAEKCDWTKLKGENWAHLLASQPRFADKCDWTKLKAGNWANLLASQPEFADKCDSSEHDWSSISGYEWECLLMKCPQFAEKCDWTKLDGRNWAHLLASQPQFADHCDWAKLDRDDWKWVLFSQPQLAVHRPMS